MYTYCFILICWAGCRTYNHFEKFNHFWLVTVAKLITEPLGHFCSLSLLYQTIALYGIPALTVAASTVRSAVSLHSF